MENTIQSQSRIHPLVAGAAASVMLVSLVGVAALTGVLPTSNSKALPTVAASNQTAAMQTSQENAVANANVPRISDTAVSSTNTASTTTTAQTSTPVHHSAHKHHVQQQPKIVTAQNDYSYNNPQPSYASTTQTAPTYSTTNTPVATTSPARPTNVLGIGAGAVIGGLLGHQIGGGNGKTLATIAGAVGGGYLGNEVQTRYGR